ncbi:MAG: hypothetical protein ACOC6N_03380 [archaeon]
MSFHYLELEYFGGSTGHAYDRAEILEKPKELARVNETLERL